jgi:hypothetical protein
MKLKQDEKNTDHYIHFYTLRRGNIRPLHKCGSHMQWWSQLQCLQEL